MNKKILQAISFLDLVGPCGSTVPASEETTWVASQKIMFHMYLKNVHIKPRKNDTNSS